MNNGTKVHVLGNEILSAMQRAMDGGLTPVEAIETGLMAVGSLGIQVEGEYKTGARLIIIGEGLVDGSPEGAAKRRKPAN